MTDRREQLEAELAAMRPRAVPDDLTAEVEERLARHQTEVGPDRILISAIATGAIAACVIVAMLIVQEPAGMPPASPMQSAADVPRAGDVSQALARADGLWVDRMK